MKKLVIFNKNNLNCYKHMEKNKTNYFFFCWNKSFSLGPTQNVAFDMKKIWLIMFKEHSTL
jgi:hypothetical protein